MSRIFKCAMLCPHGVFQPQLQLKRHTHPHTHTNRSGSWHSLPGELMVAAGAESARYWVSRSSFIHSGEGKADFFFFLIFLSRVELLLTFSSVTLEVRSVCSVWVHQTQKTLIMCEMRICEWILSAETEFFFSGLQSSLVSAPGLNFLPPPSPAPLSFARPASFSLTFPHSLHFPCLWNYYFLTRTHTPL